MSELTAGASNEETSYADELYRQELVDRFVAHVDSVRTQGDALDERRTLSAARIIGAGAAVGAVGGLMQFDGLTAASWIAEAAGTAIALGYRRWQDTKVYPKRIEAAYDELLQHELNVGYELYACVGKKRADGGRRVAMRLFGPKTLIPVRADDWLREAAEYAQTAGVEQLALSQDMAMQCTGYEAAALPGDTIGLEEWIKERKDLANNSPAAEQPITTATPGEWLAVLDKPVRETVTKMMPVINYGRLYPGSGGLEALCREFGMPVSEAGHMLSMVVDDSAPDRAKMTITVTKPLNKPLDFSTNVEPQRDIAVAPNSSRITTRRRTATRVVAFTIAALVATFASDAATEEVDQRYNRIRDIAAQQLAQERGYDGPDAVEIVPPDIDTRVNSWSSVNQLWGDWQRARRNLRDMLDGRQDGHGDGGRTGVGPVSGVGNVIDGPPTDVWYLTPSGGMSTEGHWSELVYDTLIADAATSDSPATINWDSSVFDNLDKLHAGAWLPATLGYAADSVIGVKGRVYLPHAAYIDKITDSYYLPVPVKDGTHIVAANYNGQPLAVRMTSSNTFLFQLPSSAPRSGQIEYWLGAGQLGAVRARQPRLLKGTMFTDQNAARMDIDRSFKANVPDMQKPDAVGNYVKGFKYKLAPLPNDAMQHMHGIGELTDAVFAAHAANCIVTATVVSFTDDYLNALGGYQNGIGGNPLTLSSNEAHMTLVGLNGIQIDDTPAGSLPGPARKSGEVPMSPAPLLLAPLLAAAGVYAYRRRRSITATGYNAYARSINRRIFDAQFELATMPTSLLRASASAVTQAMWAPDSSVDATRLERDRHDAAVSHKQALREVTQPGAHHAAMRRHLRGLDLSPAMVGVLALAAKATRPELPLRPRRPRRHR